MKVLVAFLLSVSAFSAFGANLFETIERVERENNAKCERTGQSRIKLCSGAMTPYGYGHGYGRYDNSHLKTCIYAVKFDCVSNEGDFKLKLRVKEGYNSKIQMRETKVWKVIYYR